jgi:hypothetical protein
MTLTTYYANQRTGKLDARPLSDETARDYLPQHPLAWGMYQAFRALGKSVEYAFINTSLAALGMPFDEDVP